MGVFSTYMICSFCPRLTGLGSICSNYLVFPGERGLTFWRTWHMCDSWSDFIWARGRPVVWLVVPLPDFLETSLVLYTTLFTLCVRFLLSWRTWYLSFDFYAFFPNSCLITEFAEYSIIIKTRSSSRDCICFAICSDAIISFFYN